MNSMINFLFCRNGVISAVSFCFPLKHCCLLLNLLYLAGSITTPNIHQKIWFLGKFASLQAPTSRKVTLHMCDSAVTFSWEVANSAKRAFLAVPTTSWCNLGNDFQITPGQLPGSWWYIWGRRGRSGLASRLPLSHGAFDYRRRKPIQSPSNSSSNNISPEIDNWDTSLASSSILLYTLFTDAATHSDPVYYPP